MVHCGYGLSPVLLDMILSDIDPSSATSKSGRTNSGRRIPIDVLETDNGFEIMADIPGVQKEAIALGVDKGTLTLSVSQPQETAPAVPRTEADTGAVDNGSTPPGPQAAASASADEKVQKESVCPAQSKILLRERAQHFAQRSVKLPETADLEQARAEYEAGVLKVTVPKKALSPKRISIA